VLQVAVEIGLQYDVAKITEEAEALLHGAARTLSASHSEVRPPEGQFREMWKRRISILIRDRLEKTGNLSADDLLSILEDTAATYYRAILDQEVVKRVVRSQLDPSQLSEIIGKNVRP
jgi:hypothetical protein